LYAILDIETTGGQFNEEGITEIAIYKFDGHEIVDQFISLVNPEKPIQPFVVKLTGINNAMLRSAPKFYEVAKRIIEITEDCIVVAHNASFDYRILRTEFKRLGYDYIKPTLCTVELAQKLIPGQLSYSLGKLVRALGIPVTDRHRASGDAMATVKLFKMILAKDTEKEILISFIKAEIKSGLTPKLLDIVESLPTKTGIYYIHNDKGDLIYIGKSRNIKKRVNQHFTGTSGKSKKTEKYNLCQKINGLYDTKNGCFQYKIKECNGACLGKEAPEIYNERVEEFIQEMKFENDNMVIVDRGRTVDERCAVLIENGIYKGYCFYDLNYQINNIEILKNIIIPMQNNRDTRTIIKGYLRRNKVIRIIKY